MCFRRQLILAVATAALLSATGPKHTYTGTITDNMCGDTHHDMEMGPDPACIQECVKLHGAKYSLLSGKELYTLSDQNVATRFVAKKVTIKGVLDRDTMTLRVESIAAVH
jgi:hypothetical protein